LPLMGVVLDDQNFPLFRHPAILRSEDILHRLRPPCVQPLRAGVTRE